MKRLKEFWMISLVLVAILLPISSFAQSKQNKPTNKQKTSVKKQTKSSIKETSPTSKVVKEETPQAVTESKQEEKSTQTTNSSSVSSTTEASSTPSTAPKRKTLDNSDIEAYGLAPEVKSSTENKAQSSPEPNSNSSKPNASGRKGRYGFNVPSSPTPK